MLLCRVFATRAWGSRAADRRDANFFHLLDGWSAIELLLVNVHLTQDGPIDSLEHHEPDYVHSQQSGQKYHIQSDKGVELGAILGVAMLRDLPNDHWQTVKAEPKPEKLCTNEGDRGKVGKGWHIGSFANVTEDVWNVMQDDYHCTDGQEVTDEVPEAQEAGHCVVQEHLLVVVSAFHLEVVVNEPLQANSKLEQAVE